MNFTHSWVPAEGHDPFEGTDFDTFFAVPSRRYGQLGYDKKRSWEVVLAPQRAPRDPQYVVDFRALVAQARKEGWGAEGRTPGERAHNAALALIKYAQEWIDGERGYWCARAECTVERLDGSAIRCSAYSYSIEVGVNESFEKTPEAADAVAEAEAECKAEMAEYFRHYPLGVEE